MLKIWYWIEKHPVIGNPIVVAVYAVLAFLVLDTTDVLNPATYKKALAIGLLALFSGLKNALESYQKNKS